MAGRHSKLLATLAVALYLVLASPAEKLAGAERTQETLEDTVSAERR